jgi:tetratricopeptide (TPR) repeat protein
MIEQPERTVVQSARGIVAAVAALLLATACYLPFKNVFDVPSLGSGKPGLAAISQHLNSQVSPQPPLAKTKICLQMIVKNEEEELIKFLENVKDHITGYVICDTGSTDKTISLATNFFRSVGLDGTIEHHTWINFAANRNLCLDAGIAKMADHCDYWLISEPDHVFISEDGIFLPSLDLSSHMSYYLEERNVGIVYNTRRILSTKLKWGYMGAVHEYVTILEEDGGNGDGPVGILPKGIYVHHNIKFALEKYKTYRDFLEKEVQEHPEDPRSRYYLGQTYAVLGQRDEAILQWLTRILLGPSWIEEQYMAALNLANELGKIFNTPGVELLEQTQDALFPWIQMTAKRPTIENVISGYFRAAQLLPYRHEAWYHIANIFRVGYSNYAKCYEYANKAKESGPHTADTLFSAAVVVEYHIDDELCICGHYAGAWSAIDACRRIISKINELNEPEEWQKAMKERAIFNLAFYNAASQAPSATTSGPNTAAPTDNGKTRVIFHSHQLGKRGTEVSLFDYGMWLEIFYNAEAHFAFPYPGWTPIQESPFKKFTTTFPGRIHLVHADNWDYPQYRKALDDVVIKVQAHALYRTELQNPGYEISSLVPTLVHEVFNCSISRRMGAKYKAISEFVQTELGGGCTGVVPYMVWLPQCTGEELRSELGISKEAFVFAWYGGHDAWDPAATEVVRQVAAARANEVVFLLQHFPPVEFLKVAHLENVILVPSTSSMLHKCRFIQTADAFLHTRLLGETFGLAVAEFSLSGKPTITNVNTPHRFHLHVLGNNTFIYETYEELYQLLMLINRKTVLDFFPSKENDDNGKKQNQLSSLYSEFSPCKVMKQFNDEFFDGKLIPRDNGTVLDMFCADNTQVIDLAQLKTKLGIRVF